MDGNGPGSHVQWLLSRMIGAYASADQSAQCGDFAHYINASRCLAEQLRQAALSGHAPCPVGVLDFLEMVERTTAGGQTPEDRELLGLMDWAHRLYEECGSGLDQGD
ncbi:hypothetical protein [Pararhodospirillum oryzae]|uniref:Uncharacterized protein n=1 Tax=Pararhodospirillum oryzae TaxID=478448 RepID=A0A512H826_9PROT|nr:hypothetical protein [Pararhodospirillum oryzae]GEO81578.1 hypothetical protein ROR02_17090 [Pararhodospirillum oryzae]